MSAFGTYSKGSLGHLLQNLLNYGIPMHICETVVLEGENKFSLHGAPFCEYRYFDELERPIFKFETKHYKNIETYAGLNLTLNEDYDPCLYIEVYGGKDKLTQDTILDMRTSVNKELCELHNSVGPYTKEIKDDPSMLNAYTINFRDRTHLDQWFKTFNELYRIKRQNCTSAHTL